MIRVSAFPTVEWLHSRAADRPAVPAPGHRSPGCTRRHSMPARRSARGLSFDRRTFVRILSDAVARDVSVHASEWVATPEGEQQVDIVIRRGDRHVGLMIGRRYEQDVETMDALRLVYGRFDALFRITGTGEGPSVHDVLYALVCEKPTWFTAAGRMEAGRRASDTALVRVRAGIRRMRLSRANEWVVAFEKALTSTAQDGPGRGTTGARERRR